MLDFIVSQYLTERCCIKTNRITFEDNTHTHTHTNAHDTSADPLTTIVAHQAVTLLNALRICHSPNAYSIGTQAKRSSSVVRRHHISMPTLLKKSLVCKSQISKRHSTHRFAFMHPTLKKEGTSPSFEAGAVRQIAIALI